MAENNVDNPMRETNKMNARIPTWVWVIGGLLLVALIVVGVLFANKPQAAIDDSWKKVQAAGLLRVATSADYLPFSYSNQDFVIDGFDPALIREIGNKLGVEVQITDYAFEGLGATLQAGQADVAIAAIAMTADRAAVVDFSNVYYVGEDGVLARADSNIDRIDQVPQFAGLRVGVQKRSVYQAWAQKSLVDYQVIPQDKLFTYAEPAHAVSDLKLGRLDLVVMDLQPAIQFLSDADLKLVGQGFNQQRFAIAIPRGADTLKAQIDQALLVLQNEGRVNQLAQTYLGLRPEDIIQPPTPEPTHPPCTDAMQFVDDLNYDDQDLTDFPVLDPGVAFQKGWRVKNTGTCEWTNPYFIKYVHSSDPAAQMGGQPTIIKTVVGPGQTYDMFVDLFAPKVAGKYVGYWQMHNANGVPFGQTIWVAIEVRDTSSGEPTATATVEASPTPPPPATTTATVTELPPTPEPTREPGSDLQDITWVLEGYRVNIDDEQQTEPIPDIDLTLNFDEDDNFSSFAGCNTFSGRYVTNGIQIIFRDFQGTQLACDQSEGIMEQEALYSQWLERAEEYHINENGKLEFIFYVNENNQRVEKIFLQFYDQRVGP